MAEIYLRIAYNKKKTDAMEIIDTIKEIDGVYDVE